MESQWPRRSPTRKSSPLRLKDILVKSARGKTGCSRRVIRSRSTHTRRRASAADATKSRVSVGSKAQSGSVRNTSGRNDSSLSPRTGAATNSNDFKSCLMTSRTTSLGRAGVPSHQTTHRLRGETTASEGYPSSTSVGGLSKTRLRASSLRWSGRAGKNCSIPPAPSSLSTLARMRSPSCSRRRMVSPSVSRNASRERSRSVNWLTVSNSRAGPSLLERSTLT